MVISILASLLFLLIPVLLIAGVVYLVMRSRSSREGSTLHDALAGYIYTIIGASTITAAIGVALFIDVALRSSGSRGGDEVTMACVLAGTGAAVGLLHFLGKRAAERRAGITFAGARRVYLFFMLGIASLSGLVSLPGAIYAVVSYYAVEPPAAAFPHTEMAIAVVVVPLWAYYLCRVIRETARRPNKGGAPPPNEIPSPPAGAA